MSIVSVLIIIASLSALSMLHEEKRIDDTCAIVTLIAGLACLPGCILGDPVLSIIGPFMAILCIVGSLIMTKQSNQELEQELHRDAAREAAGPSVAPLSEAELNEVLGWVLQQYQSWRTGSHAHDSIVIACEDDRMRFSGGGSTVYRPHSHRVLNDVFVRCFSDSEQDMRYEEQKRYRRELSERILQTLASYESEMGFYSKYTSSFWIDDLGDILGPWERRQLV